MDKRQANQVRGVQLDKDVVNNIENYINYIHSYPKLVQTVDEISVADTGMTGHYLTLEFPCEKKTGNQSAPHLHFKQGNNQVNTHGPTLLK